MSRTCAVSAAFALAAMLVLPGSGGSQQQERALQVTAAPATDFSAHRRKVRKARRPVHYHRHYHRHYHTHYHLGAPYGYAWRPHVRPYYYRGRYPIDYGYTYYDPNPLFPYGPWW